MWLDLQADIAALFRECGDEPRNDRASGLTVRYVGRAVPGGCAGCGRAKLPGRARCARCLRSTADATARRRADRAAAGLCACGRPLAIRRDGAIATVCPACLERQTQRGVARHARLSSRGLCACGGPLEVRDGRTLTRCVACVERDRRRAKDRREMRRALGFCACGRSAVEGYAWCAVCRDQRADSARKWRKRAA